MTVRLVCIERYTTRRWRHRIEGAVWGVTAAAALAFTIIGFAL